MAKSASQESESSSGKLEHAPWLERCFAIQERGSSVKTEVIAGLTTFLTMAYIIFLNPNILGAAGMDHGAVFVATCLAAAMGCLIMGFYANYPIALAPGMGLNAFFSFVVVGELGYSWQVALGAVFVSGVVFFLLSVFRIREWIINSIPMTLRQSLAAGVGLFLAIIALKTAGIVVDSQATLVTLGDLTEPAPILTALGFFLIVALAYRQVTGAVMLGILAITLISLLLGLVEFKGVISAPPSMAPTFMQLDIAGALEVGMISVIFAFLFVDLFDTAGTLMGVADRAKLLDKDGNLPQMGKALMADSSASMFGSLIGSSTTTSFIESSAGVAAGGRTGLTAVVCAALFLVCIFLSPLAGMVPSYATAGALLYVAVLMTSGLSAIDWDDITESAPAIIAAVMMPLSFSIANGIALGFISYAVIKVLSGRYREVTLSVYVLAAVFVAKFVFL